MGKRIGTDNTCQVKKDDTYTRAFSFFVKYQFVFAKNFFWNFFIFFLTLFECILTWPNTRTRTHNVRRVGFSPWWSIESRRRFKATPPTVFRGRSKYKTQIFFCFVHTHARTADTRTRASNPLKRRKINYWSYINEHNTTNDITETRCTVARGLLKKNNSNYKIDSIFLYIRAKKQVNKNTISQYFDGTRWLL